ncbi:hypothetical protein I4U23_027882 [Adineta vaga]|nr:hypothetical protein I4U23_027882 [Adineta vaga]
MNDVDHHHHHHRRPHANKKNDEEEKLLHETTIIMTGLFNEHSFTLFNYENQNSFQGVHRQ